MGNIRGTEGNSRRETNVNRILDEGRLGVPSEKNTPMSKDCWRRSMLPKLQAVGLGWCNFQVMRRSHATLMRQMKAEPHQVAAQLGHTVDVVA